MRFTFVRRRARLLALTGAILAVGSSVAYATIPSSEGTYTACVLNNVGTIRLIDKSLPSTSLLGRCTRLETEISWSKSGAAGQQGPVGDKGPTGDQGLTGATGAKGPAGDKGPNGEPGATGDKGLTGETGAKGPTGDPGPNGGVSSLSSLAGLACTVSGLASTTAIATSPTGVVSLTCPLPPGSATSEVQTLRVDNATGGTFTISFRGQLTTIPAQASAATVQAALESLSTIGVGNVVVTGAPLNLGTETITFTGTLSEQDVPQLIVDNSGLTGFTPPPVAVVVTIVQGGQPLSAVPPPKSNEVQMFRMSGASGGTFTLAFGAQVTGPLAYNATAADIQTALEGLAAIGVGDVIAAGGPLGTADVTLTFQLRYAGQNVLQTFGNYTDVTGPSPLLLSTTLVQGGA